MDQNIFYEEFLDKIDALDDAIETLQADFSDKEQLNEMFRAIHTVKGTADLLGMFELVGVVHKAEDLLDEIRNGEAQMDKEICSVYKELNQYLKLTLDNVMNGVFDDMATQNLAIYFTQEFTRYLQMVKDGLFLPATNKTILIVESSSLNRYLIKKVANDLGYNAYMCDNGVEGIKKLQYNNIDLVFCDISQGCEKSQEFLKQVHEDILYDHIPSVLLIDYFTDEIKEIAKSVGAKAWLKRPIEVEKLSAILHKLLD